MARNSQQLEEQITFMKLRRDRAISRVGKSHLDAHIAYLEGELALQRQHEANREQTIARLEKHLATMETETGRANIQAQIDDERGELALQRQYDLLQAFAAKHPKLFAATQNAIARDINDATK